MVLLVIYTSNEKHPNIFNISQNQLFRHKLMVSATIKALPPDVLRHPEGSLGLSLSFCFFFTLQHKEPWNDLFWIDINKNEPNYRCSFQRTEYINMQILYSVKKTNKNKKIRPSYRIQWERRRAIFVHNAFYVDSVIFKLFCEFVWLLPFCLLWSQWETTFFMLYTGPQLASLS